MHTQHHKTVKKTNILLKIHKRQCQTTFCFNRQTKMTTNLPGISLSPPPAAPYPLKYYKISPKTAKFQIHNNHDIHQQ